MIESPTYFMPVSAVLNTFRKAKVEDYRLFREIVKTETTRLACTYVANNSDAARRKCYDENMMLYDDSDHIDDEPTAEDDSEDNTDTYDSDLEDYHSGTDAADSLYEIRHRVNATVASYQKILNPAQADAYLHAITNRLAIIQGPPGTGKTFLGTAIVETILPCMKGPILVVTSKNHALDEFLKGLVNKEICKVQDLVRVGGRSKVK